MKAEKLTLTFRFHTLPVDFALQRIQSALRPLDVDSHGWQSGGAPLKELREMSLRSEKKGRANFNVTGNGFEFNLGRVRNCDLDFLLIGYRGDLEFSWDEWANWFLGRPTFVMAWIADLEYDYWQNAYDPLQYKARNRSFDHLPVRSNGLPYPLHQMIIDTSRNPGRYALRNGYHEAVGSVMRLGEPFWQLTGATQSSVENAKWLRISRPAPTALRVQSADHCFSRPDGSDGEAQQRLRQLLFRTT